MWRSPGGHEVLHRDGNCTIGKGLKPLNHDLSHAVPRVTTFPGQEAWTLRRNTAMLLFARGPADGALDAPGRLAAVLAQLSPAIAAVRWGRQVHGSVIASLAAEPGQPLTGVHCVGRCDGLITAEPGLALAVWTADCVPVLIDGGEAVAAIHAGWRGIAGGIVNRAVRRLEVEYGVPPAAQTAFLGPAIGPDHYPVGAEVVDALSRLPVAAHLWQSEGNRVDLRALIDASLQRLGVAAVHRIAGCTSCDPRMASYRRDGDAAGRQWSLIFRCTA